MKCPACQRPIARPAQEGGMFIKARYLRFTTDGKIIFPCPECQAELEQGKTGRLTLTRTAA